MPSAYSRARLSEPELASLKSAARAAIVMPAVFAFADKVIGNTQTATFAAFGSFAMLVLVEFTGRPAIGFAISLGVGLLFWPRGRDEPPMREPRSRLRKERGVRRRHDQAAHRGTGLPGPDRAGVRPAVHQLDDAFREHLADRSATKMDAESMAMLVAGAARVRRAGQSLSALRGIVEGNDGLALCGENLDGEVNALRTWYVTLGDSFVHASPVPPPHVRDAEGKSRLLDCVREAVAGIDESKRRPALVLLWTSQHLDNLWRLEAYLGRHATEASRPPA